MLKSYEELRALDIRPYCEDRDGYSYLNWAKCIDLLRENGAEKVYFEPIPNPKTGGALYWTDHEFRDKSGNTNRCYETRIRVYIDDNVWEFQTPVLNGANPVKDNSMNQLRVWNSMCRSFVKCVAIHTGLGFDLWLKEEQRALETVPGATESLATETQIKVIKDACRKHRISFSAWVERAGKTEETLTETEAAMMLRTLNAEDEKKESEKKESENGVKGETS